MPADLGVDPIEPGTFGDPAQSVEDLADPALAATHVVEVLAVSPRPVEPQLVEAGPATEYQFRSEHGIVRDLDDEAREHEILLDLVRVHPRHGGAPLRDVGVGDHWSCSMSVLTMTRQRRSRSPSRGPCGSRAT